MRDKDPVIWLFKRSLSVRRPKRCDVRKGAEEPPSASFKSEEVQRSHHHQIHKSLSDSRASKAGSRALVSRLRGKAG